MSRIAIAIRINGARQERRSGNDQGQAAGGRPSRVFVGGNPPMTATTAARTRDEHDGEQGGTKVEPRWNTDHCLPSLLPTSGPSTRCDSPGSTPTHQQKARLVVSRVSSRHWQCVPYSRRWKLLKASAGKILIRLHLSNPSNFEI